jgi:hypothetical protein
MRSSANKNDGPRTVPFAELSGLVGYFPKVLELISIFLVSAWCGNVDVDLLFRR